MIEFADRFWLLLLPVAVAALVLLLLADRRGRRAAIRRFASDRLVARLLASYSPIRKRLKNTLLVLATALLFTALARPQWGHTWTESRSRGIDIVFALDSSRSMLARDIKPNRLIRARLAIEDFVNRLDGDRIGLVAFSGSAFLQCPLTLDYDAFFQSLDAVDTNVISEGGTDLAAALEEAEAAFASENNFKIVVLITDGEDLEGSGIAQAREAEENGVTVYSVGVGTAAGAPIPMRTRTGGIEYVRDRDGQVVQSSLDPDTLQTIAEETGGFYVELGPTGYGLEQVLEAGVGSIPEEEISSELQRTAIERFQWPLAAAFFLLIIEPLIGTRRTRFRRRGATTLLATLCAVSVASAPNPLMADSEGSSQPQKPSASHFSRTLAENPGDPVAQFNRGTELYQEGDYKEAAKRFTEALRLSEDFTLQADAFHNLGNTRFQEGLAPVRDTDPAGVTAAAKDVVRNNEPPMRAGESVLQAARAGHTPQQQQIQSTIQALRERENATATGIEETKTALATENTTRQLWRRSLNDFESALELSPEHDDARHNLGFVKEKTADLSAAIREQELLEKKQEDHLRRIRDLIEELEKLLEQQENQQDQQSEDRSGKNDDESPSENEPEPRSETGEDNTETSPEQGDREEDANRSQQPAGQEDELAEKASATETTDGTEEAEQQEPHTLDEEEAEKLGAERAAATAEEGEPEGGEEVVIGVMSTEDAARLLDSLKNSERKLPFAGSGSEGAADSNDGKDW